MAKTEDDGANLDDLGGNLDDLSGHEGVLFEGAGEGPAADLEDDIAAREMTLYRLQCELAEPRVLRDGQRVRELKAQLEAEQSTLKALYEHWEEAAELNW